MMRANKVMFMLIAIMMLVVTLRVNAFAEQNPKVMLNDTEILFDVKPQVINSRLMVPLRRIFDLMNIDIEWDANTQTITGSKSGWKLIMQIDSLDANLNGKSKKLDSPPVIINGNTLVPLRFIAESTGATVSWNESSSTAYINTIKNPPVSLKGKKYPSEKNEFVSEEGYKITQLTSDKADDAKLYFTSECYVPEDNGLVFTSKRTGSWNLFYMKLDTGSFVQLTDGKSINSIGAVVSPVTREVFYMEGRTIKSVNLDTLKEKSIYTYPKGHSIQAALSITDDGKTMAFAIAENIVLETKTDKLYSEFDEKFEKRPWSTVLSGNTDGTGWHEVIRQKKWISHTIICPTDSSKILFCHEGAWNKVEQRMWLVNSDGSDLKPLRIEENPSVQIGHEFWMRDGIHIGYQCTPFQKKGKHIGIVDSRDGSYTEYLAGADNHVQSNEKGDMFIGDGSDKAPYISLYNLENGNLRSTRLFRHNGTYDQQHYHPHPSFSQDGNILFFTSSRAGNSDIYMIRLK